MLLLCSFFRLTGPSSFDTMVFFYIRGIADFSFSQSGCSWRFSDGRFILSLVRLILCGTAAYVNLPPLEVVPLVIDGKIVLVSIDNRRLACFVIAQIQLGNNRKVSVPVKFTCINELCGRRLRRYRRTAMLGIRRQIRIRIPGHHSSLIVSIQGHWRFVLNEVDVLPHAPFSLRIASRR